MFLFKAISSVCAEKFSSSLYLFIYSPVKCFTGLQCSAGYKASLQSTTPKSLLSTGSARAGSRTLSSGVLSISEDGDFTTSEQPPPVSDNHHTESFLPYLSTVSCIAVCACFLLPFLCAPLRRVWLHQFYNLP